MDPVTAGIIGGSSLLGGLFGSRGAKRAAREQAAAQREATAEARRQFNVTQQNLAPYIQTGLPALSRLGRAAGGDMSDFYASPDYDFRMQQGVQALDRSAAARGMLRSGAQNKALLRYGQGLGAGEFDAWWSRQAGLAGMGLGSTNNLNAAGMQTSQNVQGNMIGAGNARAMGTVNATNAWTNALQQGVGLFGLYRNGGFGGGGFSAMPPTVAAPSMPTWGFGGR